MKSKFVQVEIDPAEATVPGMITKVLRQEIVTGVLKAGMKLRQEELATRFDASMTALREALKNLEAEDLVVFTANRGATVKEMSAENVREISEIRIWLEMGALELAIPHLTDADIEEANEILARIDEEHNKQLWDELNWDFHAVIYRAAGRDKLFDMLHALHNSVQRYMSLYLVTMRYQERAQTEHRMLLEACREKNIKKAQRILQKHIKNASARVEKYIERQKKKEQ